MRIWKILTLATVSAVANSVVAGSTEVRGEAMLWPEVWGDLGLTIYATGERVAPNGVLFDPIFISDFKLNIGLLPRKKLYLFLENEFWGQRAAPGITNTNLGNRDFSKRELDFKPGLAGNIFDRLELRTSFNGLNNLNRGPSRSKPSGARDGVELEWRYYLPAENDYDPGRLNFVSIGYYPWQSLIGGDGLSFHPGLFARVYLTCGIPASRAYFYGDLSLISEESAKLRLITLDGGVAIRPFGSLDNFELRMGEQLTADLEANTRRDLVYGAVRVYYGGSSMHRNKVFAGELGGRARWPEIWGDVGLRAYATGERTAPNGVPFEPIFMSDFNLNLGLLSRKRAYLFLENAFWVQRANARVEDNVRANDDFSEREYDLVAGLAVHLFDGFELRASAYALNNLNRSLNLSTARPSGYQDGEQVELRYYLPSADSYDESRLNFVSIGYYPSQTLVGGDGFGFHPSYSVRANGSYDIPAIRSYIFGDARLIGEKQGAARLVTFDTGVAARPFRHLENLEFRVGNELTTDLQAETTRDLVYGDSNSLFESMRACAATKVSGTCRLLADSSRRPRRWRGAFRDFPEARG